MATAILQQGSGIESVTIKTDQGQTIVLQAGKPAVIKDANRHLVAAIQRLPVQVREDDDDGDDKA